MRQIPTLPTLAPQQMLAIEALLTGETITSTAESVGVDRTTVHRWLKEDFEFQATLNAHRREMWEGIQAGLWIAAAKAVEAVTEAIEAGDGRMALQVLKGVGALSGQSPPCASDDPDILRQEAEIAQQASESDRQMRKLLSSFG